MANRKHIMQLLSSNGDGTGTTDAIGDYSSTPLNLRLYGGTSKDTVVVHRLIVSVQDSGTFDADKYGNGITLTNGIRVYVKDRDDATMEELTAFPILSSGDWAAHCHDATLHDFGQGDSILTIRWTFSKSGLPVILKFAEFEYMEIVLNDDFSGLVHHRFQIQGHYTNKDYE